MMPPRYGLVAVLIALGVGWGVTQPLSKIAVSTGYQQFGLIFWQAVIGAIVLGALMALRGRRFPLRRAPVTFAVLIALLGTVIPGYTFYRSIVHLPSGIMSILIAAVPMLSFPMAIALGRDRFSLPRLGGLVLGLIGVALIALPATSLPDRAMTVWLPVALIGPLCYALEGNYVATRGTAGLDAVQAMFGASAVAALIALPIALARGQWINPLHPWGAAEWALVASSTLHAALYATYVWLAARAGAVFATQCSYVVTASGVVWAMLLLGERFSPWVWAAMAVMLMGLFLVSPRSAQRE